MYDKHSGTPFAQPTYWYKRWVGVAASVICPLGAYRLYTPGRCFNLRAYFRSWHTMGDEAGQSFVELAFVLPVLVLVLAGVFDVGRSVQSYVVILNASREVAMRGAANNVETALLVQVAEDELERGGLNADLAEVVIEYQGRGFPEENHILVQVNYRMPLILAVLSFDAIQLGAYTEMIVFW